MLLYINWDGFSYAWYQMARQRPPGTPNLDRLIAQGACLDNHYCGIPAITNPMQQTLVSGAWPQRTGNCYVRLERESRFIEPTLRLNRCETLAEAARRQGKSCASVHGWFFENRGCRAGDPESSYIHGNWPNFETRVAAALDYLQGKPVPSGDGMLRMRRRPDLLAIYADDIDTVCHNGLRLPYPELKRATCLADWYQNLTDTVHRMDRALAPLMALEYVTIALAADHGGMPFGTAAFGVSREDAAVSRRKELLQAIRRAGVNPHVADGLSVPIPKEAETALLCMDTQALLYAMIPQDPEVMGRVRREVMALPFIDACMPPQEQRRYGAADDFCELYITTRPPWHLGLSTQGAYVGGSHAATAESVMHVFCAFWGHGIRPGARVSRRTTLPDFAPTLARLMGIEGPRDHTGDVLSEIILDQAK